jgi:hypothetical protein
MLPLGPDAHARIYPLERTRGPTRSSARVLARMQFTHARNDRARVLRTARWELSLGFDNRNNLRRI